MAFINQGRLLQSGTRSDGPYMRNFKVDGSRTDSDAMAVQSSHFERFMHFATSSNIEDRQLAVKSVAETMRTLDIDADQYRLERFGGMVESIFETDEDSQLRCILLEQMPAIYSEFANAGLMGSRTQEVFLKIIIESLVHFSDQIVVNPLAAAPMFMGMMMIFADGIISTTHAL
ncbi:unnamed protein product [Anisakis simplex]|uniref:Apoptosis regulator BAX n=1 Tax=Anisakis simplex TaxID=6269 RepID=A0A0M3JUJ2_ANISI|nr:unnamed protein product [Anisakis simplex]